MNYKIFSTYVKAFYVNGIEKPLKKCIEKYRKML